MWSSHHLTLPFLLVFFCFCVFLFFCFCVFLFFCFLFCRHERQKGGWFLVVLRGLGPFLSQSPFLQMLPLLVHVSSSHHYYSFCFSFLLPLLLFYFLSIFHFLSSPSSVSSFPFLFLILYFFFCFLFFLSSVEFRYFPIPSSNLPFSISTFLPSCPSLHFLSLFLVCVVFFKPCFIQVRGCNKTFFYPCFQKCEKLVIFGLPVLPFSSAFLWKHYFYSGSRDILNSTCW